MRTFLTEGDYGKFGQKSTYNKLSLNSVEMSLSYSVLAFLIFLTRHYDWNLITTSASIYTAISIVV